MPTTPRTLSFSRVITTLVNSNIDSDPFTVPADCVWKIESAGVGGTNGAIYLLQGSDKIAILATTIGDDDYASPLPFWLEASFAGKFRNESNYKGVISITEYVFAP